MLPRMIKGWNAAPGRPDGWDEARDGRCGALAIRMVPATAAQPGHHHELRYVESAWEPTPDELDWLNAGHSVILRVMGWQPPVGVYVDPGEPGDPVPVAVKPELHGLPWRVARSLRDVWANAPKLDATSTEFLAIIAQVYAESPPSSKARIALLAILHRAMGEIIESRPIWGEDNGPSPDPPR